MACNDCLIDGIGEPARSMLCEPCRSGRPRGYAILFPRNGTLSPFVAADQDSVVEKLAVRLNRYRHEHVLARWLEGGAHYVPVASD